MSLYAERQKQAEQDGRIAALRGETYGSCPYSTRSGIPDTAEASAWRKGYQAAEVEEAEGAHFRERK